MEIAAFLDFTNSQDVIFKNIGSLEFRFLSTCKIGLKNVNIFTRYCQKTFLKLAPATIINLIGNYTVLDRKIISGLPVLALTPNLGKMSNSTEM